MIWWEGLEMTAAVCRGRYTNFLAVLYPRGYMLHMYSIIVRFTKLRYFIKHSGAIPLSDHPRAFSGDFIKKSYDIGTWAKEQGSPGEQNTCPLTIASEKYRRGQEQ